LIYHPHPLCISMAYVFCCIVHSMSHSKIFFTCCLTISPFHAQYIQCSHDNFHFIFLHTRIPSNTHSTKQTQNIDNCIILIQSTINYRSSINNHVHHQIISEHHNLLPDYENDTDKTLPRANTAVA
jgi:hypothetical protein